MELQKRKYLAGYLIAMCMMAVAGFRLIKTVPEEIPVNATVKEQSDSGPAPAYQQLYPDMYADTVLGEVLSTDDVRRIYLTFDDGPSQNTKEVVEALKKENAKAAFFLIGENITEDKEELLREMVADGHILGVHTYTHRSSDLYSSVESFLEDFHKTYERIYEVTGVKPVYYRFPWGSINCYNKKIRKELIEEMERRGFEYLDWNVSAEDSVGKPTDYSILHNVIDHFGKYKNAVVLMHDSSTNTASVRLLPEIMSVAEKAGYEFGSIDQLEKLYHWPNPY